jgi:hypothetical protein
LGEVQYVESLEHPKILTKLWWYCHTFHKNNFVYLRNKCLLKIPSL